MQNDIGLNRTEVKLKEHNKNWRNLFEQEKELLLNNFPNEILEVSHGGSTAIPDIPAKPIIDMFAVVPSLQISKQFKDRLENLNYHYRGNEGVSERILYTKGEEENRTHNLHLVEKDNIEWRNHLLIKNYYLAHPEVALEYAALKEKLALQFPNDRKAYGAGKDTFIKSVISRALESVDEKKSSNVVPDGRK